jgi:hypothetical protein
MIYDEEIHNFLSFISAASTHSVRSFLLLEAELRELVQLPRGCLSADALPKRSTATGTHEDRHAAQEDSCGSRYASFLSVLLNIMVCAIAVACDR